MLTLVYSSIFVFVPHANVRTRTTEVSRSALVMKKQPDETPAVRPELKVDINSIVEFHDPKHGSGVPAPVLGLVKGVEYKAKGGARLQVMDASGAMHAVAEKSIHVNLGVHKGKLVEPSAILADFQAVMALEPTALGVDPESLAMAWELAAEEEGDSFSTKFLLSLVDDTFFKAQTDAYRAFRLLSSDLGKVFFKNLGPNAWKAKAAKAVEASKQNWCRELKEDEAEWCLV